MISSLSALIPKLYVFVGRFSDPADQVAHFALARFNESAFVSLRFGGVMTPPYEKCIFNCDKLLQQRDISYCMLKSRRENPAA